MGRKREPRSAPIRPYLRTPIPAPISVERAAEEGLLIARSALTMEVKNHIIVTALRDDRRFDAVETASWVRRELTELALEQADSAERMRRFAGEVSDSRLRSEREHDYGPRDYRPLTRRGLAYSSLSDRLTRLVDDAPFVAEVVEEARARAWSEIGAAIEARLDLVPMRQPDAHYARERETRLRVFVAIDLARLVSLSPSATTGTGEPAA